MNQIEAPITDQDIKTIKRKVEKTKIFLFVFLFFIILWSWGLCDSDSYFTILNIFILVFDTIVLIVFSYALKRLRVTQKDLKAKIKIVDTFKVIDKYYTQRRNSSYIIIFDSKDIPKYEVTKRNYGLINVNDTIEIEYSKFAFWVLKIEHNKNDIENKQNLQ
jgi:hypothetical protein